MYKSRIDLPEKVRVQINTILQNRLADAIDLSLQAKQAHWNVKGPSFIALHELFDKIAAHSTEFVDDIAERIVAFGGIAEGTVRLAAKKSTLPEYPLTATTGKDHATALAKSLATFGEAARKAIDESGELKDAGTSDLFTGISRSVDKLLWFVEAHTQAEV